MVERSPDKTEVEGSIPSVRTKRINMNKILIVEDRGYLIKIIRDGLDIEDYVIDVAKNSEEAIEKIKINKPDLILLDLLMTERGSFYILEAVKSSSEWKSIPIIVFGEEDELIKKALEAGADDYFVEKKLQDNIAKMEGYLNKTMDKVE